MFTNILEVKVKSLNKKKKENFKQKTVSRASNILTSFDFCIKKQILYSAQVEIQILLRSTGKLQIFSTHTYTWMPVVYV